MSAGATGRRQLVPFAALSASYFAHIGFFNPYLPLWLKELGFGLFAISSAKPKSAVVSVNTSGVLVATMPARVSASTSRLL